MNDFIGTVQSTIDFIDDNLTAELSVKDIANRSNMSIWQYQRIFRAMVGDSIGNYLRHRRLTDASIRLKNTNERIIDIAIDLQFSSQEAFSRAFKTFFGVTPNQVRKNNISLVTKVKPIITPEQLKFLNGGIEMIPKIITRPPVKLVGMELVVSETFSKYTDFRETIGPLWEEFFKLSDDIYKKNEGYCLGILKHDNQGLGFEENIYLAAYEVAELKNIPNRLVGYQLPEQKYAVFTNKGLGDKTSFTMNYIYGTWLPQSGYKRATADDFELFDERYDMNSSASISDYYLPIA